MAPPLPEGSLGPTQTFQDLSQNRIARDEPPVLPKVGGSMPLHGAPGLGP